MRDFSPTLIDTGCGGLVNPVRAANWSRLWYTSRDIITLEPRIPHLEERPERSARSFYGREDDAEAHHI